MIACLYRRGKRWSAKVQLDGWANDRRVSLGTTDKQIAQQKLQKLVEGYQKVDAGLALPQSMATRLPLARHVADFLADLRSRHKAKNTVRVYEMHLRKLSTACGWLWLEDVTVGTFCAWRNDCGLHGETANDYLAALSRFFNWLKRQRRWHENPVEYVERVDTRTLARQYRRALTASEVLRLFEVSPHPRRVVYRMVAETGLRRSELKGLRWSDLTLPTPAGLRGLEADSKCSRGPGAVASLGRVAASDGGGAAAEDRPPHAQAASVRVQASVSKNRRTVLLPLGPELAADLLTLRKADTAAFHFVFEGIVPKVKTFRRDLEQAGIPFEDDTGRRVDLHALRVTFGTALVLEGAEPRVVMEAMRHSDLKLTMKTYMDAAQLRGPVSDAVMSLPWNRRVSKAKRVTG